LVDRRKTCSSGRGLTASLLCRSDSYSAGRGFDPRAYRACGRPRVNVRACDQIMTRDQRVWRTLSG
jgi:hypothetical protein